MLANPCMMSGKFCTPSPLHAVQNGKCFMPGVPVVTRRPALSLLTCCESVAPACRRKRGRAQERRSVIELIQRNEELTLQRALKKARERRAFEEKEGLSQLL